MENQVKGGVAGILDPIQDAIINENVFWLKIMMEHSRFIASLLDQSERNLVKTALKFGDDFETLLNQARDVESMLYKKQPTPLSKLVWILSEPVRFEM